MIFMRSSASDKDPQFLDEDDYEVRNFIVSGTKEKVIRDTGMNDFTKPNGSSVDFTSCNGEVATGYFMARTFVGKEFAKAVTLEDLVQAQAEGAPVLVATESLLQNLPDDPDTSHVASIRWAFEDGKALPFVPMIVA